MPFSLELDGCVHLCDISEKIPNFFLQKLCQKKICGCSLIASSGSNMLNAIQSKQSVFIISSLNCYFLVIFGTVNQQCHHIQFCKDTISYNEIESLTGCLKCNFSTVWQTVRTLKYMTVMQIYWITNAVVIRYILQIRVQPANQITPMNNLRLQ